MMKRIYVEWVDAYTRDGWNPEELALKDCNPMMLCKTLGWLVDQDDKRIVICHTFNDTSLMGCLHIPLACVKKMRVLK